MDNLGSGTMDTRHKATATGLERRSLYSAQQLGIDPKFPPQATLQDNSNFPFQNKNTNFCNISLLLIHLALSSIKLHCFSTNNVWYLHILVLVGGISSSLHLVKWKSSLGLSTSHLNKTTSQIVNRVKDSTRGRSIGPLTLLHVHPQKTMSAISSKIRDWPHIRTWSKGTGNKQDMW